MDDSDAILIRRVRAGDRGAFRLLLERHYDTMLRFAYKNLGNRADAADMAQDVCLRLADKLAGFRGESAFSTWLYRVVLNACRDWEKKHRGQGALGLRFVEFEQHAAADARDRESRRAALYRAVAELDPPLPETVTLVLSEGLSHAEAGRVLGCAESTISWRLHEARKLLKARFAGQGDAHAG